ncbi:MULTISPECIES: hypothetical protein [Streptomyces]|uniref:Uncharacterized protein n=1 Tax=Streptomyces finlayi TaxID=67296 RepID=A0A7G7BPK2_9ACTN|nr:MULTISPECIES: hypothetical protein [Streptomyces]RAS24911.1 hypothetical protein BCL80_113119 [Streptomyces avidinii]SNX80750.1 hypothetical protein SAMN05421860_112119 [Streptomyces microflavus]MCX5410314.1 hypothetical protein [Streptomyces sp. NBC_00059]MCX5417932.1 hypothetical protein [Streptomyces sp. NBC_00059]QNE77267.1 hypothetical protein F0344_24065 [Streptomyces finlayi]
MPSARTDLDIFAAGLADRLPGAWTSEYHRHLTYPDQFPVAEQIWDAGHVSYVATEFVLGHDAVLHGPDQQHLYLADRPRYPHQFVVAPLEPDDAAIKPHHFDGVDEPNGIVVPNDPARAAALIARRVLPRYEQARQAVRRNAAEQPEPPHRQAPPQVAQVVTLTWYDDGALGTPYARVPEEARMTLYAHGFQYHPHQAAFLLPAAYGEDGRARRIQAVALRLAEKGIGVNLRHAAPTTTTVPPAAPPTAARGAVR